MQNEKLNYDNFFAANALSTSDLNLFWVQLCFINAKKVLTGSQKDAFLPITVLLLDLV